MSAEDPTDHPDYAQELAALLEAFGDNVRELRETKLPHLSQEQVAELARVHRTEWGLIERGRRNPRLNTLIVVASTLGTSLDDLVEGIDVPLRRKRSPPNKKGAQAGPPAGRRESAG